MSKSITFAVIGAGHGGKAMAADLAIKGFKVRLFNRTHDHIETICARGGIELERPPGTLQFADLELATSDIGDALADADCIMVVVPATAHRSIAEMCAPHLHDGQMIILNPGRTGGALEFTEVISQCGCTSEVVIAEAQTLIIASRSIGPAQAKIFRVKNAVPVAALYN